ncbi:unnamed protein product [Meganyctiphanes norvegica]|uniref:glutathione transferase n=1 Tax=Meganyctiphanes norvegica TaxID=48144 RepID=A0AAV2QRK0_MEGNR
MPEYKLIYFNMKGRAELARWCFAYGGIPYIDDRIDGNWAERKKEMPGGQVPVLMVNGKPLSESLAIARYVAKQAGLVPEDDLEAAGCDAIVDALQGIMAEVYQKVVRSNAEPAEKQRLMKEEILPNKINPFLNRLNERLSTREWFISDKITWADLNIALSFASLTSFVLDVLKDYPAVKKLVEKVHSLDSIKKWLSTRPVTEN